MEMKNFSPPLSAPPQKQSLANLTFTRLSLLDCEKEETRTQNPDISV